MAEALWTIRDANAGDRTGLLCLWLESFWSSSYGKEFRFEGGKMAYWAKHEPIVKALIGRAKIRVACDTGAPEMICAFLCTEGESVIHYMMAKRSFHRCGASVEMFKALLGPMMDRACTQTHELPELNRAEVRAGGFVRPRQWVWSPYDETIRRCGTEEKRAA